MNGPPNAGGQAITLSLLPSFGLTWAGLPSVIPARAQQLVVLLALAATPLQRGVAAARLWPDVVNSRANASLRATLWGLTRGIPPLVVIQNNLLSIHPAVRVELTEARDFALAIIEGTCNDQQADRAYSLLVEDLLPDWSEDWLSAAREQFRQLRLHALDALCVRLAEAGQFARAITVGLAGVASEPTRESAYRALMTAHLLKGNRMEALRAYHAYLTVARREMGIGPSRQLEVLFQAALEDAPVRAITPR